MAPHLPDEVIEIILSALILSTGDVELLHSTLSSLSLLNKQWHRVVEPSLYKIVYGGPKGGNANLTRTLIHNRYFGPYAKALIARRSPLTDWKVGGVALQHVLQFEEEPGHRKSKNWYKKAMVHLPVLLPNIEYLDVLEAKKSSSSRPWLEAIRTSQSNLMPSTIGGPCFSKLKRLDADINGMAVAELYPVFRLPAIEILNFLGGNLLMPFSNAAVARYFETWPQIRTKIKHLNFTHAIPPPDTLTLKFIAAAVPNLCSLTFIGHKKHGFGANLFRSIIDTFKIPITNPNFYKLEMWDERATKPDKFDRLRYRTTMRDTFLHSPMKVLKVDFCLIRCLWFSSQNFILLPKTVHTLILRSTITHSETWVSPFLQCLDDLLANVVHGGYPNLKVIMAELQAQDLLGESVLDGLKEAFGDEGVRFECVRKKDCAWTLARALDELWLKVLPQY
ncbi:hypothetical protein BDV96DRAFT_691869 [Lophiotrema nucula]|uniref:Uncharacterized protein n=1 Tax=Lophiotrema nucula TaxID=690887 RepID=A0A6A5YQS4_9PLEO|nr:hypothetical protein BDV96DRAFT_691869 [Lophiotrema nucula]